MRVEGDAIEICAFVGFSGYDVINLILPVYQKWRDVV